MIIKPLPKELSQSEDGSAHHIVYKRASSEEFDKYSDYGKCLLFWLHHPQIRDMHRVITEKIKTKSEHDHFSLLTDIHTHTQNWDTVLQEKRCTRNVVQ